MKMSLFLGQFSKENHMNWAPVKFFGGWALWFYTLGILLSELILGGKAARLIVNFYDFELGGIAIDAFCRDIYKDTKNMAVVFLLVGGIAMLMMLVCFIYFMCYKIQANCWSCQPFFPDSDESNLVDTGPLVCNLMAVITAVGKCGFITWKVYSLSSDCSDFWNMKVSPDFIHLFESTQSLLIISGIGAGSWILGIVILFICANFSR